MEGEIDKLEKTGMIERADNADSICGSPSGSNFGEGKNVRIRICYNYKITVNLHMEDITHPLPRIEEFWEH